MPEFGNTCNIRANSVKVKRKTNNFHYFDTISDVCRFSFSDVMSHIFDGP